MVWGAPAVLRLVVPRAILVFGSAPLVQPGLSWEANHLLLVECLQLATPLVAGITVAAAAMGGRYMMRAWQAYKARPVVPRMRRFYPGGFERVMTRREAALILGVREHAVQEKIREAHRRVMVANHPDTGGSHFLASKINEAKDILSGKMKGTNVF